MSPHIRPFVIAGGVAAVILTGVVAYFGPVRLQTPERVTIEDVSFSRLSANLEQFQGKNVRLSGYVILRNPRYGFDPPIPFGTPMDDIYDPSIYQSEDEAKHLMRGSAFFLDLSCGPVTFSRDEMDCLLGGYAEIEGEVRGRGSPWSGVITRVRRLRFLARHEWPNK